MKVFIKFFLKTSLVFLAPGLIAFNVYSAPYCDGSFDDHLDRRCPPRLVSLQKSSNVNAAMIEGVNRLSKRMSENLNSKSDSNFLAFVHAAKACYEVNESGEFLADLAGSKACPSIRNSHLSQSLSIYARMTKTNIKDLA